MKVNFEHSGIRMEIIYDNNGYLEAVKNLDTGKYMMLESKIEGTGFKIVEDNFMLFGKSNVCDARYFRIMDIDVFIPKFIFIPNIKTLEHE